MLIDVLAAALLLGLVQTATSAQASASPAPVAQSAAAPNLADSPTPTDPKELLEVGRKVNALSGPDVQPWHLKASFELFDSDGKSKDKGTYEEWWVSEKEYKRVYASPEFARTEYGTDNGTFHSGSQDWPSWPLSLLRRALVDPIPTKDDLENWGHRKLERKFGAVRLPCAALAYKNGKQVDESSPSFCFDASKPILLYSNTSHGNNQTVFSHISLFNHRYAAGDISVLFLGKPSLSIHVEKLEALDSKNNADMTLPAGAVPEATGRIVLSSLESGDYALKKVPPQYPASAKQQGVQGEVIMDAIIGADGRVRDLRALAGPQTLRQPAVDAVRQWLYKPYVLNGSAMEVQTEVYVIFSLGGR
jgi:TonB family protein